MLYALFEVCTSAEAAAEEAGAAASGSEFPTMELALSACLSELRKTGVTSAPPPNPEAAKLADHEAALKARVAHLEAAVAQWDAASRAPLPSAADAAASAVASAASSAGDTRLLAELPPLPPLEAQLAELGVVAGFCAEQLECTQRQVKATVAAADMERTRLGKAVHQLSFKGYLDVHEPKALLKGLLAM